MASISGLSEKGIKGQDRDFTELLDLNRAAISALDMTYQFLLSQEWNDLCRAKKNNPDDE